MNIHKEVYPDVINQFISDFSDGWINTQVSIQPSNEGYSINDDAGLCAAVGFIRGWNENWDDKCLGLIVHPRYRGRGYGSLMLHFLETVARNRGEKRLRLHVNPHNHPARKLYEKNYWYPYGRRDDGEIIMYKQLVSNWEKERHASKNTQD